MEKMVLPAHSDGCAWVKVNGGRLAAYPDAEPDYPGIRIYFEPDETSRMSDADDTLLATVEQSDGILYLRSYMDTKQDEPENTRCSYDVELMGQVAYYFYREYCKARHAWALEYIPFLGSVFHKKELMEKCLPQNLYPLYLEAVKEGGELHV